MERYDDPQHDGALALADAPWAEALESASAADAIELLRRLDSGLLAPSALPAELRVAYERLRQAGLGRREFLRLAVLAALAPSVAALLDAAPLGAQIASLPNRVAAGDATETSVVLWARSTQLGAVVFVCGVDASFTQIVATLTAEVTDPALPVKVVAENLTPGTRYFYRVTDAAGASDTGSFRTAHALRRADGRLNRVGFRLGVSGDWRGELAPYPAIKNAPGRDLDLFVLHGDTIYADFPSPGLSEGGVEKPQALTLADYRAKHAEGYGFRADVNYWGELRASTAVLATIDDHEVLNDFAGGAARTSTTQNAIFTNYTGERVNDTELFDNALQAFNEYNPLRDERYGETGDARTANKRKLYRYRRYGADAAVFVLDTRSFRDAPVPALQPPISVQSVAAFLASTYAPNRTLLGAAQLSQLQSDLLDAQRAGITWKFVLIPEPIQNLGPLAAQDRYEGYAAERAALLQFIGDNRIRNVVFVAADIHGTVVNNVTYATGLSASQVSIGAFEVTTGSVAFDAPFGPTAVSLAAQLGLLSAQQKAAYDALPTTAEKDAFLAQLYNSQIGLLGYSPLGLEGGGQSPVEGQAPDVDAQLIQGGYVATHTFGWTEFVVDAQSQRLTVTTYGIAPYTRAQREADPEGIKARTPAIVSQFVVTPRAAADTELFVPLLLS
jgi:phosphodiesterase/alkaline phosphatase D-like protein